MVSVEWGELFSGVTGGPPASTQYSVLSTVLGSRFRLTTHHSPLTTRSRTTMKAAYIEKTGGPEVIQYGELPRPTPGKVEVLVRVGAVAVNPIDTYIRAGVVKMQLPMPFIVGC